MSVTGWELSTPGGIGIADLSGAYRHCETITRRSGSSFAAAFWMLPRPKRRALHAIYAFCRLADDIADDPEVRGDRGALLSRWRAELDAAYRGDATHPVALALGDAATRYGLPERAFRELLLGVETDLEGGDMETWADLERYCYRVASTVGLLLVSVLGYQSPRALAYAEAMGIAVQLTNVLRDVGDDAATGRIYLPREDLDRHGVGTDVFSERRMTDELRLLLAVYAERARIHYERASALLPDEDRRALRPAQAMGAIYHALLDELQRRSFPCFDGAVRLSQGRRLAIAASVWLGREGLA